MNINILLQYKTARQYSGQELATMLTAAGFADVRVTPTFGYTRPRDGARVESA